jgi:uncharacterized YccA/Bax inhibitor family protein
MMRTSNPAFNPSYFSEGGSYGIHETMTVQGTINKCFFLFFLLLLSASWVWGMLMPAETLYEEGTVAVDAAAKVMPFILGGGIVGFILAIVTVFNRKIAKFTAPGYAICEGLLLGGISAIFEQNYPGIVIQAVALTFGVFFCMLTLYRTRIIKVTKKFILGVTAATGAICLVYFVSIILGFFGRTVPMIHSNGIMGIGFSLLVVGIAAFNLILDFHIIEQGEQHGAEKHMEWYGAFALMVTLVWLYLEILRLLAKMNSRR